MKKILITLLSIIMVATSALFMISCIQVPSAPATSSSAEENKIRKVYNSYVAYAEAKGEAPLSYEMWLLSIRGEDGLDGKDGENGKDGVPDRFIHSY